MKLLLKKCVLGSLNSLMKYDLKQFRDKYLGQRCFIVGNGPSINCQNLSVLYNEYVFATNRLILHHNYDNIKPSFYCVSDPYFINNNEGFIVLEKVCNKQKSLEEFPLFTSSRFLFSERFRSLFRDNVYYIYFRNHIKIWETELFSWNIEKGVYWGHTIIIDYCLPIAYYMGFKEVILLGCDMDYSGAEGRTHFYGLNKASINNAGTNTRNYWYSCVNKSYEVVKKYYENDHRTIYDATHNGRLRAFNKIDLLSLFR